MSNNLIYPHVFTHDDLEQDDHAGRRSGSKRKARKVAGSKNRGGSPKAGKHRAELRPFDEIEPSFEVVMLTDEWSTRPGTESPDYFMHTHFAWERAKQRSIKPQMTAACLLYGDDTWQAASTHRMVTDRSIAAAARDGFDISSLRGLTLVLIGRRKNVIKTGYKVPARQGRLAA